MDVHLRFDRPDYTMDPSLDCRWPATYQFEIWHFIFIATKIEWSDVGTWDMHNRQFHEIYLVDGHTHARGNRMPSNLWNGFIYADAHVSYRNRSNHFVRLINAYSGTGPKGLLVNPFHFVFLFLVFLSLSLAPRIYCRSSVDRNTTPEMALHLPKNRIYVISVN